MKYNPLSDIKDFIEQSQLLFPHLNCGIASLYLKHILKEGKLINGAYRGYPHTYLMASQNIIIDITADQFGGPRIYYGSLKYPWKL